MYNNMFIMTSGKKNIFRLVWISGLIISSWSLSAQWNPTLFNMQGIPQSQGLNPGRMPLCDVYLGLPLAGNINARFSNSGFNLSDLLPDNTNGGSDFFDSDFEDIYDILGQNNQLMFDLQANLLDAGFRVKKNFFSFTVSEQVFMQMDFPKAVIELFQDINKDIAEQQSKTYDLSNLGLDAQHYRSFAFGYTRVILPNLSAGVRIKRLSGLSNFRTENNGLSFYNNLSKLTVGVNGSLAFYTSGLTALESDVATYLRGGGNPGWAFDAGVQFAPTEKVELFASAINVGHINWEKDLHTDAIQSTSFSPSLENIQNFEEDAGMFFDSLLHNTRSGLDAYRVGLPAYAYVGGNYYLLPQVSVGFLLSPRFFEGQRSMAYALHAQARLRRILQAGISYTWLPGGASLGAAASLNLGPAQVFLASDNFLSAFRFQSSQNAHVNVGMNLSFGRRTRAEQQKHWAGSEGTSTTDDMPGVLESTPMDKVEKVPKEGKRERQKDEVQEPTNQVETVSPAATLNRFVMVSATVSQASSQELLKGIQVDVFQQRADGQEQMSQTQYFFNGAIQLSLERNQSYRIVVYKNGVGRQELFLPATVLEGKNTMELQFKLE